MASATSTISRAVANPGRTATVAFDPCATPVRADMRITGHKEYALNVFVAHKFHQCVMFLQISVPRIFFLDGVP